MSEIRQRAPFTTVDEHSNHILNDEEQEQIIETFRVQNDESVRTIRFFSEAIVSFSAFIHLWYLVYMSTGIVPKLWVFPSPPNNAPFPGVLISLSLFVHANLYFMIEKSINAAFDIPPSPASSIQLPPYLPLSFFTSCSLAVLAPVLSRLSGAPLSTTAWWSATPILGLLTHYLAYSAHEVQVEIEKLKQLRYIAHGA